MDSILTKLYAGNTAECVHDIILRYKEQGYLTVNFLYFANAMSFHLFEPKKQNERDKKYVSLLLDSDFLLPDGIALQLRSKWTEKKTLHNLNGTDLTPKLLSYLNSHHKTSLYIYSLYDPKINKGKEWLDKAIHAFKHDYSNIDIAFTHQSLYVERGSDFPWKSFQELVQSDKNEIKVFLNCTGTPFQEVWTGEHKQMFIDNQLMVINAGGFIDFVAGYEKRAPQWVVKARVLETFWRVITNPKKNFKKFAAMFGVLRLLLQKVGLK